MPAPRRRSQNNTVTGLGQVDYIAQNGIQVSFGGSATGQGQHRLRSTTYTPTAPTACGLLFYHGWRASSSRANNLFAQRDEPLQRGHDRVYPSAGRDRHAGRVNVGIKLRLQGTDGGDLGIAHAPPPVELGDVLALADGSIWRVVNLIDLRRPRQTITRVIDMLCMVEPA